MKSFLKRLLVLTVVMLSMSSCIYNNHSSNNYSSKNYSSKNYSSKVEDKQTAIVSDFSSMDEIIRQYAENEVRAKKTYAGKRYQLTGKVSIIGSSLDEAYLVIKGNNDNAFWFYLLPTEVGKATKLSKGDIITVSGVLDNYVSLPFSAALMFHNSRFESPTDSRSKTDNTTSSTIPQGDNPKERIMVAINAWNVMHNTYNSNMANEVYAPKVLYYWSDYSPERIKTSKASLFDKYPEFQQTLSNIEWHYLDKNRLRVDFTKSVKTSPSSVAKDYDSYVVLEKFSGRWKVVEESDLTTDKNMAKKLLGGMSKIAEKDFLSLYSKVEKKATGIDDRDCLTLYLFNNKTKKRDLLFTTGYDNVIASNIRVLNSSEKVTIPSIGSIDIVSEDKVLVSTEETPCASVYLYDLSKKGCIVLSDAYGEIGLTTYNGIPAISIIYRPVADNGRYVYVIYYDFDGNVLGQGRQSSLQ